MVKLFLFSIAIPSVIVLFHSICAINSMSESTRESIRWSNITIASGAFIQILAFIQSYSVDYGTWQDIKMMFSGSFLVTFGYAVLYISNKRKCDCLTCLFSRKEKRNDDPVRKKANC